LPLTSAHVEKGARMAARQENRLLIVVPAMRAERAEMNDLAAALDVNKTRAHRIVEVRDGHTIDPLDVADLPMLAKSGPGGLRLARRILAMVESQIREIEFGSHR
jgi:hypothetical protein